MQRLVIFIEPCSRHSTQLFLRQCALREAGSYCDLYPECETMPRTRLGPDNLRLIKVLRRLRGMAGWTIAEQAAELGLPTETLRGVLFGKNRPGPQVLDRVLALALRLRVQMSPEVPVIIDELHALVLRLLPPYRRWLTDQLRQRVANDFVSVERLVEFLAVESSEWDWFSAGGDPSSDLLYATARAYRAEAQLLDKQGRRGVRWCEETAASAERLLTYL